MGRTLANYRNCEKRIKQSGRITKISTHYNIPKERIIAFGDEDNDFEMIEFAGHGIAMGNAIPELKHSLIIRR